MSVRRKPFASKQDEVGALDTPHMECVEFQGESTVCWINGSFLIPKSYARISTLF